MIESVCCVVDIISGVSIGIGVLVWVTEEFRKVLHLVQVALLLLFTINYHTICRSRKFGIGTTMGTHCSRIIFHMLQDFKALRPKSIHVLIPPIVQRFEAWILLLVFEVLPSSTVKLLPVAAINLKFFEIDEWTEEHECKLGIAFSIVFDFLAGVITFQLQLSWIRNQFQFYQSAKSSLQAQSLFRHFVWRPFILGNICTAIIVVTTFRMITVTGLTRLAV